MSVTNLSAYYLNKLAQDFADAVDRIRYFVGLNTYEAVITDKTTVQTEDEHKVRIGLRMEDGVDEETIEAMFLYDAAPVGQIPNILALIDEIHITPSPEGVVYYLIEISFNNHGAFEISGEVQ